MTPQLQLKTTKYAIHFKSILLSNTEKWINKESNEIASGRVVLCPLFL